MAKTVVGLFDDVAHADTVVRELIENGANREHISVIRTGSDTFGQGFGSTTHGTTASGAAVGGSTSTLGSLFTGSSGTALPGIGTVHASGPLSRALSGNQGGSSHVLIEQLRERGVSQEDAAFYAEGVRRGSTLVVLRVHDDDADDVAEIMESNGAVDIHERSTNWRNRGWKSFDHSAPALSANDFEQERQHSRTSLTGGTTAAHTQAAPIATTAKAGEVAIPIVEEQLQVGKREVQRRGVRLVQEVRDVPVEETIRLREERVRIERRPVDRAVTAEQLNALDNRSIDITERAEEAVVGKTARVKEEVVVHKDTTVHEEKIRDTVRSTDVRIEEDPKVTQTSQTIKKQP